MTKELNVKAGQLLGELARRVTHPKNNNGAKFTESYIGRELPRDLVRHDGAVKVLTELLEKFAFHRLSRFFPELPSQAIEALKETEGIYDSTSFLFGFWDGYHSREYFHMRSKKPKFPDVEITLRAVDDIISKN
jgi:hypothetical protein